MQSASLPWIQHSVEVDASTRVPVRSVHRLQPDLRDALAAQGVDEFLAPQCAMWEMSCGGMNSRHDICLCFPTGSGKTLAYVLPILQNLAQANLHQVHCLRALIVLPTKTLLNQVLHVLWGFCEKLNLRVGTVGRSDISDEMEMLKGSCACRSGLRLDGTVDILLSTPGRLLTHLDHTYGFSLRTLRFLVLDEADHLMKKRHRGYLAPLMERIKEDTQGRCIEGNRLQKIVVSATVSRDVHAIALLGLHRPKLICPRGSHAKRYQFPEGLKHTSVILPAPLRPLVLVGLLKNGDASKTLIFCSTKEMSKTLTDLLMQVEFLKGRVIECYGELSPKKMHKAINTFKRRESCILVATDVMARGMDVDDIQHVISYDAPTHVKTYLHRVGRTARIGRSGVTFCLLRKQLDEKPFTALCKKLKITPEPLSLDVEALRVLKPEVDAILNRMANKRTRSSGV